MKPQLVILSALIASFGACAPIARAQTSSETYSPRNFDVEQYRFKSFYEKFAANEHYQKHHIAFPITTYVYKLGEDGQKTLTESRNMTRESYTPLHLVPKLLNGVRQHNDVGEIFVLDFEKNSEGYVVTLLGRDSRYAIELHFAVHGSSWALTKIIRVEK